MGILKYPLATEKSVGMIEKNNVIVYIVDFRATKPEIRKEFEDTFNVKVSAVRTLNTPTNTKKAFIKLSKGYNASDVAVKLKLV
jgi:ribosomal protein L23